MKIWIKLKKTIFLELGIHPKILLLLPVQFVAECPKISQNLTAIVLLAFLRIKGIHIWMELPLGYWDCVKYCHFHEVSLLPESYYLSNSPIMLIQPP